MSRPKGDWVYRHDSIRADGNVDGDGTYDSQPASITAGIAGSDALVLYDSKNYLDLSVRGSSAGPGAYALASAARAEGSKARIFRVQGMLRIVPGTWAVGNSIKLGLRIGVWEQDMTTGAALADPSYSMWRNTGNYNVAQYANARRQNLWERRFYKLFNSSEANSWMMGINVPLRVRLDPHEALFLYLEVDDLSPAGVTTSVTTWLRSFVVDEGSG